MHIPQHELAEVYNDLDNIIQQHQQDNLILVECISERLKKVNNINATTINKILSLINKQTKTSNKRLQEEFETSEKCYLDKLSQDISEIKEKICKLHKDENSINHYAQELSNLNENQLNLLNEYMLKSNQNTISYIEDCLSDFKKDLINNLSSNYSNKIINDQLEIKKIISNNQEFILEQTQYLNSKATHIKDNLQSIRFNFKTIIINGFLSGIISILIFITAFYFLQDKYFVPGKISEYQQAYQQMQNLKEISKNWNSDQRKQWLKLIKEAN